VVGPGGTPVTRRTAQRLGELGGLGRQRVEQGGRVGHGALHRAGQLREEHLARLQVGELGDLGGVHRLAVDVTALDHQERVLLGEVTQPLGRLDHVALDEGDRGRALQQVPELLVQTRVGRGDLGQRVLHHGEPGVLAEIGAQLVQLCNRQPAVLGQHGAAGAPELFRELGDRRGLVGLCHGPPSDYLGGSRRGERLCQKHRNAPA